MSFTEASGRFVGLHEAPNQAAHVQIVAPRTFRDLKAYFKPLNQFFGKLELKEIHVGHLVEYQRARSTGDGFTRMRGDRVLVSTAGANKINHELQVLIRVLRMAGCWQEGSAMVNYYRPLQAREAEYQPALSVAEQKRFLDIAASNPNWRAVYCYALVALHTTFSSDELRTIRQGDINLEYQILGVNRRFGKNAYRRRDVPLSDGACLWALGQLLERALDFVGNSPEYFLFPARVVSSDGHWQWDGNRPMSETGLRREFDAVRKAAGLEWFRWNGFRHTAITRLAEVGVPIAVIKRRAGHVTNRMSEHYTHISEQAERIAIQRASGPAPLVEIGPASMWRRRSLGVLDRATG